MDIKTNYAALPDYLEYDEVRGYFVEFLNIYSNVEKDCFESALLELMELSDRQWHTYKLIDKEIKTKISGFLMSVMDVEDYKCMSLILCIIPRLGLGDIFEYIVERKDRIRNPEVVTDIEASIKEYGANVDDPYFGMPGA